MNDHTPGPWESITVGRDAAGGKTMSREIWEQVQVFNVNVGDVIMINTYGHPLTIADGQIDKNGGIALPGYQIHSHDTVFRRVSDTEDPRVLRRLLDNIARDEGWSREAVACWIEETRMELESEAGDE